MQPNLERMIQLAQRVFDMEHDPEQLSVDEAVLARLRRLHPACLTEETEAEGPVAWILVFPTTSSLMEAFLDGRISEQQLFEATPEAGPYQAVYLCSALVLPERQRQGLARRLLGQALRSIAQDHPIQALFHWPFSPEGRVLAQAVAQDLQFPLREREGRA